MEQGLNFLQSVAIRMNEARTDEELLNFVIDKCIDYTGATSGSLMIVSSDGYMDVKVCRGFTEYLQKDMRLKVGEGITGLVAQSGQPYLCPDTELDEAYFRIKGNIRSEIAVPMLTLGETIGVINLDSRRKNAFTEQQLDILMILASTAALIHNKISTIDSLRIKVKYQDILLEVAEILNDGESLHEKFRKIMIILKDSLLMERGTIVLRRDEGDEYSIHTAVGLGDEAIKKGVYRPGEGVTGKIIQSGDAIAVKNIYEDADFLDRTRARRVYKKKGYQISFIGVPIKIKNDIVGVLSVDKPYEGAKYDEDISLLRIIASFLAQALQVEELTHNERKKLLRENALLKEEVQSRYSFDQMVGISPAMVEIYKKIELVASSEATVLVTGESGTGKELVVDAIHSRSKRASAPLVKINCAAIPDSLLESELFGHKKGAFTGASHDKKGRVLLADGGTLFLDEIGDMPVAMQTKLLRVIQNKEVDIVGGSLPVPVDVRIIAATSRKLENMIREGGFREDLFYRLNVFRIDIPPLRERREDIELIARSYLKSLAAREGVEFAGISFEALNHISSLPLEGNVRELQNILEQAFLIAGKGLIEDYHLEASSASEIISGKALMQDFFDPGRFEYDGAREGAIYKHVVGEVEAELINWALEKTGGNRSEAARILGINRNTLNAKLRAGGGKYA